MLVKELIRKYSLPTSGKAILVYPDFPLPKASKLNLNNLPIALLKIGACLREYGYDIELVFFDKDSQDPNQTQLFELSEDSPDIVFVTSVFTYWSESVKDAVQYYKRKYNSPVIVGGIYASLMPQHCKEYTECDEVVVGVMPDAEDVKPAYDLVDVDFQILHTTRGCTRQCKSCATYMIEPCYSFKNSIKDEIQYRKLVFYDNNFLGNPFIDDILDELVELKRSRTILWCQCQSGLDGRILLEKPYLIHKMKKAGFKNIKIAWDGNYNEHEFIRQQIDIIAGAGYKRKNISVFMLYNHELPYIELEKKRLKCWEYGVQVNHCRYRPLDQLKEKYNPLRDTQTTEEYYIHPNWTDYEVKMFSRNVRGHNSCLRWDMLFHSYDYENRRIPQELMKELRKATPQEASKHLPLVYDPSIMHTTSTY